MQTVPTPSPFLPGEMRLLTADEHRQNDDHDWCLSDREILLKYAEQVVAVYRRQVWGHGLEHDSAGRSAEQALASASGEEGTPAPDELVYVVIPVLAPAPAASYF
jgi:hypothetical protein